MSSGAISPAGQDQASVDRLLSRYYAEFRAIARKILGSDQARMMIQPTELVHEAALRLLASDGIWIKDQAHFLALGARTMRLTLIDEVRRRRSSKRDAKLVTIWDDIAGEAGGIDLIELDHALERFAEIEPEGARIVELRFFVGLTLDEIADTMALSESTVTRRWRSARAWLLKEMAPVTP